MRKSIKKNVKSVNKRRVKNKNKVKSKIKKGGGEVAIATELDFEEDPVTYLNTTYEQIRVFAEGGGTPIHPNFLTDFLQCVIGLENRGFTVQYVEGSGFNVLRGNVPDEQRYFNKTNHTALVEAMSIDTFLGDGTTKAFNETFNTGLDGPKVRKILTQGVSNIVQCRNSGGAEDFVEGVTRCVWCGQPIFELAECEHVLPVLAASALLQFGRPGRERTESINLEYGWAHRVCNQRKNDDLFIRWQRTSTTWVSNDRVINQFYRDLGNETFMDVFDKIKYPDFDFRGKKYTGHKYRSSFLPHYHINIHAIIKAAGDVAAGNPKDIPLTDPNGKSIGRNRIVKVLEHLNANFIGNQDKIKCRMLCKFFCCVAGKDLISVIMGRGGDDPNKVKMQEYLKLKTDIETRRIAVETTLRELEIGSVIEPTGRARRPYRISSSDAAKKFFIVIRKIWSEFDGINEKIKIYHNREGLGPDLSISFADLTGQPGVTSAVIDGIINKDIESIRGFLESFRGGGSKKQKGGLNSPVNPLEILQKWNTYTTTYLNKIFQIISPTLYPLRNLLYNHLYEQIQPTLKVRPAPESGITSKDFVFLSLLLLKSERPLVSMSMKDQQVMFGLLAGKLSEFFKSGGHTAKAEVYEKASDYYKQITTSATGIRTRTNDDDDDDDGADEAHRHSKALSIEDPHSVSSVKYAAPHLVSPDGEKGRAMEVGGPGGEGGGKKKKKNTKKKKPQKKKIKKTKKLNGRKKLK